MSGNVVTFSAKGSDADSRKASMQRELEDRWDRVHACLTEVDPRVIEIARNSFWYGVKAGVCVATKAVNGAFR